MSVSITKNTHGFTIVELLIVIVVIGILAAISVVAYSGIQNRAHDAAVKSDLRQVGTIMEINHDGSEYPSQISGITALNIRLSTSSYANRTNVAFCVLGSDYGVAAVSKSGNSYYISNSSGGVKDYPGMTTSIGSTCDNMGISGAGRWDTWGYTGASWTMGLSG